MQLILRLVAASPVTIRDGRSTRQSGMARCIPGRTVWGALGAAHEALGRPLAERERWFLTGGLRFGEWTALPVRNTERAPLPWPEDWLEPPLTARTCKRAPDHGLRDSLAALCAGLLPEPFCGRPDGQGGCPEMLDRIDRTLVLGRADGEPPGRVWQPLAPPRGLLTRTMINRERGTVQEGMLYNRDVWRPGLTRFLGRLDLPEADAEPFAEFVREAAEEGLLRVGHGRTRGLGAVELKAATPGTEPTPETVEQAVEAFTARARELGYLGAERLVPLTLRSDALLPADLSPAWLGRWHGAPLAAMAPVCERHQPAVLTGFNGLTGLPAADQLGRAAGSVWVFRTEPSRELWAALAELERTGLGSERQFGRGDVAVAAAWHTEQAT